MHGYQLVAELEEREVKDWAGISRPQVYYSLKKLERAGLIAQAADHEQAVGPERRVYKTTRAAQPAVAQALAQAQWATQRVPSAFITWLVLSPYANPEHVREMVERRQQFLDEQIAKEKSALAAIKEDEGPGQAIAEAVVQLSVLQFETERRWLSTLPLD